MSSRRPRTWKRNTTRNSKCSHDWLLGESHWSPYAKSILVYDEFRPFRFELTLNAGLGYRFIDNDAHNVQRHASVPVPVGNFAERTTRGNRKRCLASTANTRSLERQKVRATIEYYPEWGDFSQYRIRSDAAWEVLLDEETNMSLKLGVIDRYDTRDSGQNRNALDYTLLLLWKL